MSIAAISYCHSFGLKSSTKNCLIFVDDSNLIYPVGSNTILYNIETKIQKFISSSSKSEEIICYAISNNHKYFAISERSEKPVATIFDMFSLRRKKVITLPDTESKEFISMGFSYDAKMIATLTGTPDWTAYLWIWDKTKIVASVKCIINIPTQMKLKKDLTNTNAQTTVSQDSKVLIANNMHSISSASYINNSSLNDNKFKSSKSTYEKSKSDYNQNILNAQINEISINPIDQFQILVIGNQIFRLYKYLEGTLKQVPLPKIENRNYLSHVWTCHGQIIVGTDDGHILIFENNGDLKQDINNTVGPENTVVGVSSLMLFKNSLMAGCTNSSIVLYERTSITTNINNKNINLQNCEQFEKVKEFTLNTEIPTSVISLSINPSEDTIVCATSNNQIFSVMSVNSEFKSDETRFELLSQPFHYGKIYSLDTCIRKPLLVTCGSDKSIRIWNYLENTNEITKFFNDDIYSVSLHPSGLNILAGFSDKLRLMNILIDDLKPYKEFNIRGCKECKFSNGGQYFAAAYRNCVHIFSTWSFENLCSLKGHSSKIQSIYWSLDDNYIITSGIDGAVYQWSLKDMIRGECKRGSESFLKSCLYTSAICSNDCKKNYAVGSDKTLKEIQDSQITKELISDVVYTKLAISNSGTMLFVGTITGALRVVKFPLMETKVCEYQEHKAHSDAITALCTSADDKYLFSAGMDGSIYMYKVYDRETKITQRKKEEILSDEILVSRTDAEEQVIMLSDLRKKVEDLKMENEYQLRLKDMNCNEKIKEVTGKLLQEIDSLKMATALIKSEKEKEENKFTEDINQEKIKHLNEINELENIHREKIVAEFDKYKALELKTSELQEGWKNQISLLNEEKNNTLKELTTQYDIKLKSKQDEILKLQSDIKKLHDEFEETIKETEEDADIEILELKHMYEKRLKDEKEIGLKLKSENGIMKKMFNSLQNEIDSHKIDISKMNVEETKLHNIIKNLEKDISSFKKEIQERDETIRDKEKRIYDLKKKNQELEKFKFVLDYKIRELKNQIEPREREIESMTDQIKEMDNELEHYNKINSNLELVIDDYKLKLNASEKEVNLEKENVLAIASTIKRFKIELSECMQYIMEPKLLKQHIKRLYHKYCTESEKIETIQADIQQEYFRQRDYLEKTISSLRKKVKKDKEFNRTSNYNFMKENITLVREINYLRRAAKKNQFMNNNKNNITLPKCLPTVQQTISVENTS
ncbi:WD repeat-containing protein 65 [Piromyces finnis]|uniref:WD repeat-containing protein 65 n=1 Tax=Piromyces finnis TaxID=1754191 RepID=A0A1Y1VJ20_9FUNG|nr:WD repeat-containing protein 65 [Piromyces finnis]|eukprot:ORX57709.1 WD repeat-containing protein 65 [Piromyces finnis]